MNKMESMFGERTPRLMIVAMLLAVAFLVQTFGIQAQPLLNPDEIGFNGQTRSDNYDELLNALYANRNVVTTIDSNLWVPWYKSSSSCGQADLQSGSACNSGSAIDSTHNCMVTDEFSQVGIITAMGKDQARMDQFYNTVKTIKSTNGQIPAWRVYRNGNAIEPCKPGINGNCDTASDATARIISALFTASKNSYFTNEFQKQAYFSLAKQLSEDFLNYEVDQTCRNSNLGYGKVCYWLAAGSNAKRGGLGSTDYAYTGYYGDAIIAMLQACANTGNQKYCSAAGNFTLNYLQASSYNGASFTVPPGRSFKWDTSSGTPVAVCTSNCNPPAWDGADAPRAIGMCQANYYANAIGYKLPELQKYCNMWGNKYMSNPSSAPLQYYTNGGNSAPYQSGYFAQGLQSLFQTGGPNPSLFKPTLDSALSHYTPATRTFDYAPCFGVYMQSFAVRSLGFGIGRDLASFPALGKIDSSPPVQNTTNNQTTTNQTLVIILPSKNFIASLPSTCSYSGSNACKVKSDVISGVCRTILYGTPSGDIKMLGCEKTAGFVELYKQAAPSGLAFSSCLANGCINKDSGFARFIPAVTSVNSTVTPITNTTTTNTTSTNVTVIPPSAATGIGSLSRACSYSGTQACTVKGDVTSGTCRTVLFSTPGGDIKIMGCEKSGGYFEVYRQAYPSNLVFTACLSKGCITKDWGFARFMP